MNGVNKVIILGNLGKDPEVKELKSGTKVANLSIATSETWKDRDGNKQERTEWHKVDLWNRQAEIAQEYLSKGSTVYVEGTLRTDKWQDQDGNDRYTTKIRGLSMTMIGSKGSKNGGNNGGNNGEKPQQEQSGEPEGGAGEDDDLPF